MTEKSKRTDFSPFQGFPGKTIEFFLQLRFNNEKPWFQEHRAEFDAYVMKPFQELVNSLAPTILSIDPKLDVTPRVDRTIARIYRDVRFSKDKSPYRSNLWINFRRVRPDWKDTPCFYFELTPEYYHYGMGFFQVERDTMDRFRRMIDGKPDDFLKATEFYRAGKQFVLGGDSFKRPLAKKDPEIAEWYNRKNFWLSKQHPLDDLVFTPGLLDELKSSFLELAPFYHYLWKVKEP